jgi:hypothetical protein
MFLARHRQTLAGKIENRKTSMNFLLISAIKVNHEISFKQFNGEAEQSITTIQRISELNLSSATSFPSDWKFLVL